MSVVAELQSSFDAMSTDLRVLGADIVAGLLVVYSGLLGDIVVGEVVGIVEVLVGVAVGMVAGLSVVFSGLHGGIGGWVMDRALSGLAGGTGV